MVKSRTEGLDLTFATLADGTRRSILMHLREAPGLTVSELAQRLSLKLPGLAKHLAVLSRAGLITRTKKGRSVCVHLAAGPMQEAVTWLRRYEEFWAERIPEPPAQPGLTDT